MSVQRTQMSAVRTGTALIGFGFTVAQFFEKLQERSLPIFPALNPATPRNVGLLLIAAGVVSLGLSTWQYHLGLTYLRSPPFSGIAVPAERAMHKPSYIVSYAVLIIGIVAFTSICLRF